MENSFKMSFILFSLVLCVGLQSASAQRHEATLDPEGKFVVGWVISQAEQKITFDVAVETKGYIGLGFSDSPDMYDADILLGFVYNNGSAQVLDCFGQGPFRPTEDLIQDYTLLYGYESATHTYLRFSRLLDTGDEEDRVITNNTTYLIYAIGGSDSIGYHGPNRGGYSVNLFNP